MTAADEVYASTLNLLGSDLDVPAEIQIDLDRERAAAKASHSEDAE